VVLARLDRPGVILLEASGAFVQACRSLVEPGRAIVHAGRPTGAGPFTFDACVLVLGLGKA
jgi:hypothetical protein